LRCANIVLPCGLFRKAVYGGRMATKTEGQQILDNVYRYLLISLIGDKPLCSPKNPRRLIWWNGTVEAQTLISRAWVEAGK